MTKVRDKTLEDFKEVLAWLKTHNVDATVIGGLAVGAFAADCGITSLSGDLDVLVTPDDQAKVGRLADADPSVKVTNRVRPRSLPVLVLEWGGGLEVDVLTRCDGLPSPSDAQSRTWNIHGRRVADPVDLLGIKLAMMRAKDLPHIAILREVCGEFAYTLFTEMDGRKSFAFLDRWVEVEGWSLLPPELFEELLSISGNSSPAGRRYLTRKAPTRVDADSVVAMAPEDERAQLRAIAAAIHQPAPG